jgi:hypothetical protein
MKYIIITLTIIFIGAYPVFSQTLKSISSSGNRLRLNETTYTSISIGANMVKPIFAKGSGIGINLGLRHQLSNTFYIEGKVDYLPKTSDDGIFSFSLVPQWSVAKNKSLNFLLGCGLVVLANSDSKFFGPIFSTKLEFKILDYIILYPEIRVPFYLIIPVMLFSSINIAINM